KDIVYNYVESGAPFDKAGGYNIDDPQIKPLIAAVDGDYDNVVGLPVKLTEKLIEENLIYGENGYRA
ncbi:MAG: Maf family protein, partial [Clostridiales bacterium]|nr:Maf family protein [Clostridiales bacterium]